MPEDAAQQQPQDRLQESEAASAAAPGEADYAAFVTLLQSTARGRALLDEYARRHRASETQTLLAALARIEGLVRLAEPAPAAPPAPAQPAATSEDEGRAETYAEIMAQVTALSEEERIALFT